MPRLVLEPEWWKRARKLFEQGYSKGFIAERMGVTRYAVRCAVDEAHREKNKARNKAYHLKRKSQTGGQGDWKRQATRKYGRELYKQNGGSLYKIYQELGCL